MMRTSNKLFGLVILLVLTLPLLVVVFLLKSVREESFTIRDPSGQKISRGMYTQGYKTLKIVAPAPDNLRCHFFPADSATMRSEEHTSELQSLMRISYAVFCLKKTTT